MQVLAAWSLGASHTEASGLSSEEASSFTDWPLSSSPPSPPLFTPFLAPCPYLLFFQEHAPPPPYQSDHVPCLCCLWCLLNVNDFPPLLNFCWICRGERVGSSLSDLITKFFSSHDSWNKSSGTDVCKENTELFIHLDPQPQSLKVASVKNLVYVRPYFLHSAKCACVCFPKVDEIFKWDFILYIVLQLAPPNSRSTHCLLIVWVVRLNELQCVGRKLPL